MAMIERRYGVFLRNERVGTLNQRGDYTWFSASVEYVENPQREILGLAFEDDLGAKHASALRLPPWFSNLLPEGRLRDWVARDRGVPVDREMELLAQVGRDLPGAVRVIEESEPLEELCPDDMPQMGNDFSEGPWRFSLAGVGLKFSMLRRGDNLTLPAAGGGGDWIVKLPDPVYPDVPRNEEAMMTLAGLSGINVPECRLVSRSLLENLPTSAWMSKEEVAYAVRRFDRGPGRSLIHIEDFAQVRNVYPYGNGKYMGSFETIANLIYRGHELIDLQQFARRLAFNVLIENGDAHLKNWSLIYLDPRSPRLSPAYDIVSTSAYALDREDVDLGLKFNKSRRYERFSLMGFVRLERTLGVRGADLGDHAEDALRLAYENWPTIAERLNSSPNLQTAIGKTIEARWAALHRT